MGAQQPIQISALELTEHLQIDRSSIADHLLTLNVTEVGPNENYHAPSLKQTLTYELRGAMLVAADNTASGSLSQNGISVRFPANWSVNRQDANSFSLISDGYKKKLADGPVKSYAEAPTADIDVLVVKSTTNTTLMQSAVAGGLTSNIATITVNGHAAVAGMRDGFSSSYVIYVQNGVNLYVIDFALREMATQLSVEERTILDSVTFQ